MGKFIKTILKEIRLLFVALFKTAVVIILVIVLAAAGFIVYKSGVNINKVNLNEIWSYILMLGQKVADEQYAQPVALIPSTPMITPTQGIVEEAMPGVMVNITAPYPSSCQVVHLLGSNILMNSSQCEKVKLPVNDMIWGNFGGAKIISPSPQLPIPSNGELLAKNVVANQDGFGITPNDNLGTQQAGNIKVEVNGTSYIFVIHYVSVGPRPTIYLTPTPKPIIKPPIIQNPVDGYGFDPNLAPQK